jgi:hypothetical protein
VDSTLILARALIREAAPAKLKPWTAAFADMAEAMGEAVP